MKFSSWYGIIVGVMIILQWIFFLVNGAVPELETTPWAFGFHISAELLLALVLITGGIGTLRSTSWGKKTLLVALGMAIYSEINSSGYFAQLGQWIFIIMFAVLLFGATLSVKLLMKKAINSPYAN